MKNDIDNMQDILDVEDITDRIEEIEETTDDDEKTELKELTDLLEEMRGNGGDHQWRGEWYPGTLIRDSHFQDYAQELAEDVGAIPKGTQWPCTCIDWEWAARELQHDYTAVEYDGITYWYR